VACFGLGFKTLPILRNKDFLGGETCVVGFICAFLIVLSNLVACWIKAFVSISSG